MRPGVKCLHGENGQQALELLGRIKADLIFLDVNMPIMGGKECLIHLKRDPALKDIPVILYSTSSAPNEIAALKQLVAKEFVIKPVTQGEIFKMLDAVL